MKSHNALSNYMRENVSNSNKIVVPAEFPGPFMDLFEKSRFKIYYGGRGAGKTTSFAKALLLIGQKERKRILCAREYQSSMDDSVWQELCNCIIDLHLEDFYVMDKRRIYAPSNGTEFSFAGIATNVSKIRSFARADICWVEEAANVSAYSWSVLIPTIRQPGSEIWISFNPEDEQDATYKLFVENPRPDSIIHKVNYDSNPWFGEPMLSDMKADRARDYHLYRHVWLGEFRDRGMDGSVYAHELRECEEAGRICHVPYEPLTGVSCFFDLGFSDATAIWFAQRIGYEYHFIDYIEGTQQSIEDYIRQIQAKEYCIDTMYLPHEAKAPSIGTGKSVEEIVRNKGYKTIVVPRLSVSDGINAVRTSFKQYYFDVHRCADGLQALRKYHYNKASDGGFQKVPAHDRWSHASDAIRVAAVALKPSLATPKATPEPTGPLYGNFGRSGGGTNWMSM